MTHEFKYLYIFAVKFSKIKTYSIIVFIKWKKITWSKLNYKKKIAIDWNNPDLELYLKKKLIILVVFNRKAMELKYVENKVNFFFPFNKLKIK